MPSTRRSLLNASQPILSVVPFRLSLASGDGNPTDLTAQSTLYWTPWGGNAVALYNGTEWIEHVITERSLALSGLTPWRLYDVFAYDNAGTVTLELTGWNAPASGTVSGATNATPIVITTSAAHGRSVNDLVYISGVGGNTAANCATGVPWRVLSVPTATTFSIGTRAGANVSGSGAFTSNGSWYLADYTSHSRATALTTQDGVYVKTGATTRRYLGTICPTSASTTDDNQFGRYVWNYYNPILKYLLCGTNSSHSYNGGIRPWNNDMSLRYSFVNGLVSVGGSLTILGGFSSGGANFQMETGVGLNIISGYSAVARLVSNATSIGGFLTGATVEGGSAAGFHYRQIVQNTNSSGSSTFSSATVASQIEF